MHVMGKAEAAAVARVMARGQFMRYRGGERGEVEQFEAALCAKIGVRHALTVNSGTSALICALVGLGIGPGDEVIVPAYTWIATAIAPLAVGAVPVLAEVDESLTLDPADVARKITRHTKAIIPVHMANLVCDLPALQRVARARRVSICEDCCQAVGLTYRGRRVGTFGEVGAFSFNQFKNITCGEGGAALTNDLRIYQRMLMYHDTGCYTRPHATKFREPFFPGQNYRATEIMGAILRVQLRRLDGILRSLRQRRARLAEWLAADSRYVVGRHHDPADAVALTLAFPTAAEAQAYAAAHPGDVTRVIESGRHVYTNWQPLLGRHVFHPKMNPYAWAHRPIRYTPDMCPRTLDILARTCLVNFSYNLPPANLRALAKRLRQ